MMKYAHTMTANARSTWVAMGYACLEAILERDEKMTKPILYLDVDGVLNIVSRSYMTASHRENLCEPHLVARLNYLLEKIEDMEIVISSSWRYDMDALKETLEGAGFKHWDRVIGRTGISARHDMMSRGEQIFEDIGKRNKHDQAFIVPIVIDDEYLSISEILNSFYLIDPKEGLSDKVVMDIAGKAQVFRNLQGTTNETASPRH